MAEVSFPHVDRTDHGLLVLRVINDAVTVQRLPSGEVVLTIQVGGSQRVMTISKDDALHLADRIRAAAESGP